MSQEDTAHSMLIYFTHQRSCRGHTGVSLGTTRGGHIARPPGPPPARAALPVHDTTCTRLHWRLCEVSKPARRNSPPKGHRRTVLATVDAPATGRPHPGPACCGGRGRCQSPLRIRIYWPDPAMAPDRDCRVCRDIQGKWPRLAQTGELMPGEETDAEWFIFFVVFAYIRGGVQKKREVSLLCGSSLATLMWPAQDRRQVSQAGLWPVHLPLGNACPSLMCDLNMVLHSCSCRRATSWQHDHDGCEHQPRRQCWFGS